MVRSLDKKWKEFLFGFSGFGPNLLMIMMGSYYSDALNSAALEAGEAFQAIMPGVCFIMPALFPILYALGKIFDGLIDIPFAHITDNLSTRWGRRRPAIAVCFLPMVISFILCWIPIGGTERLLLNTIWVSVWCVVFFAAYTMCLIAFYGSLSTVCTDEPQRLRVAGYKSFFDTITYIIVYALVPVMLTGFKIHINKLVFLFTPVMLTMLIPLFLIKEGEKYGYPERNGLVEEKLSIKDSIRMTFGNRIFSRWLLVNCCTFFGLQMFLSSMNGLIIGGMGLNGAQMAILNTCAFGPVPVMLYLFNKVKAKHGVCATYQSCLLMFAVAIFTFFLGSRYVVGEGNVALKILIGAIGGVCGSWSIGVFFMMPYLAPSQISSVEEKLYGVNHSAMYFAGNAVATSVIGAISGSLIYEYIKNLFICKPFRGFAWATSSADAYRVFAGLDASAEVTLEQMQSVYNFGNLLVPFIVSATCVLGFFLAFKLPRDFTPMLIAKQFKEDDPSLDISIIEKDEVAPEKSEIIFVQIGLWVLSGGIFGFIWSAFLMNAIRDLKGKGKTLVPYILSCFVPLVSIYYVLKMADDVLALAKEKNVEMKISKVALVICCILFPLLPLNMPALIILQRKVNKLYGEN